MSNLFSFTQKTWDAAREGMQSIFNNKITIITVEIGINWFLKTFNLQTVNYFWIQVTKFFLKDIWLQYSVCACTNGGDLVSIHSLAENTFVHKLATSDAWIGKIE